MAWPRRLEEIMESLTPKRLLDIVAGENGRQVMIRTLLEPESFFSPEKKVDRSD